MTKRKQSKTKDQPNLKRFKSDVRAFTNDKKVGFTHKARKPKQNRKERRKEERELKKLRKKAFSQRKPIPTKDEIEKEKMNISIKKRKEKKLKRMDAMKKEKKKRLAMKKEQEKEEERQQLEMQNMYDDREIRDLEKKLHLKKRKKKTLPQSFLDDGLDYLLDVVDSEKLQLMADEEGESDIEKDDFGLGVDDESDIDDGGSDAEDYFDDGDDDKDDDDIDVENENEQSESADFESKRSKTAVDRGNGPETEKWEKLAEKIKEVVGKKNKKSSMKEALKKDEIAKGMQEANSKKKKHVSFDITEDFEDDSDDEDDGEEDGDSLDKDEDESDQFESEEETFDEDDVENEEGMADLSGETKGSDDDDDDDDDDEFEKETYTEDIYGRLRDSKGNIVKDNKPAGGGAYIPPAKRLEMAASANEKKKVELERLKRQLKGLINRASESNMQPISSQIETLYLSHSRADVNQSLISLVCEACVTPVMTPERLGMELMMLVAILHGNVGSEVGAMFLQHLVTQFHSMLTTPNTLEGKEMDNLLALLAYLYNFKVVHGGLLFDILRKLVETFGEKEIELILLLLRNTGFSLRKDSPNELKALIVSIQDSANRVDLSSLQDQSRVKFMLDVILAIRNNNMRKIPNYDPEHLEHLRKLIRSYVRGGQFGDNQLQISYEDLLNADQKGKWWVIGSAWEGQSSRSQHQGSQQHTLHSGEMEVSAKLQELARKQRMNTDIRRNIFYVIMTSEDYVDAFEKLLRMGLKSRQLSEVILVILDCCLQETKYNPFYHYLSQKFCEHHRSYQMAFQFSIWDKLKEVESLTETNRQNLGKLLTHLFISKALSLSILKVVTFGTLEKQTVRLLKQIFTDMLLDHTEQEVLAVFSRIAVLDKLKQLQDGLRLFLHHFLVGKKKKESHNPKLMDRVELIDRLLSSKKSSMIL